MISISRGCASSLLEAFQPISVCSGSAAQGGSVRTGGCVLMLPLLDSVSSTRRTPQFSLSSELLIHNTRSVLEQGLAAVLGLLTGKF